VKRLVSAWLAWLMFWWLPLAGIRWDGTRWIQHHREAIPEYVLLALGAIWLVMLIAFVAAMVALAL
jgi:hypothetical protein